MTAAKYPPTIRIRKSGDGRYRYRVVSRNGRNVEASEQGFRSLGHVVRRCRKRWPLSSVVIEPTK